MTVYVPILPETKDRLKQVAKHYGRTMTTQLKFMIDDELDDIAVRKAIAEASKQLPTSFDQAPKDINKITEPYKPLFEYRKPITKKDQAK